MNNEPVAWMSSVGGEFVYVGYEPAEGYLAIPLYTHPSKEQYKFGVDWSKDGNAVTVLKICEDGVAEVVFMDYQEVTHPADLTDEEIIEICQLIGIDPTSEYIWQFARAILRKAQEK